MLDTDDITKQCKTLQNCIAISCDILYISHGQYHYLHREAKIIISSLLVCLFICLHVSHIIEKRMNEFS